MRALFAPLTLLLTLGMQARGQQLSPADIHNRVLEFIAARSPQVLPVGDTLVSWNAGRPVLFHTGSRDSGGVRAGMLRADRMYGSADVRWTADAPRSFVVQWLTPGSAGVDSLIVRGVVEPTGLRISRLHARDTVLAVPTGLWAIADYGMEELLLPAFDRASNAPAALAVFRPYGLKWDTLQISAGPASKDWRVIRWFEKDSSLWAAVLQGSHLLWVRRSDHPDY